jgi:hypothetical protein
MRSVKALLLALCLVLLSTAAAAQPAPRHDPDTILVRFKASSPLAERAQAHVLSGGRAHKIFTLVEGLQVVRVPWA